MKCLTVCQPYAHLLIHRRDLKSAEYRSWSTPYRGPLLIHAGLSRRWYREATREEAFAAPAAEVAYGAIIGAVQLYAITQTDDQCAWHMNLPLPFIKPVPWLGQQALYSVRFGPELCEAMSQAARKAPPDMRNFWLNTLMREVEKST